MTRAVQNRCDAMVVSSPIWFSDQSPPLLGIQYSCARDSPVRLRIANRGSCAVPLIGGPGGAMRGWGRVGDATRGPSLACGSGEGGKHLARSSSILTPLAMIPLPSPLESGMTQALVTRAEATAKPMQDAERLIISLLKSTDLHNATGLSFYCLPGPNNTPDILLLPLPSAKAKRFLRG